MPFGLEPAAFGDEASGRFASRLQRLEGARGASLESIVRAR